MTDPQPPTPDPNRRVEYKGEPLDAARGPGLGCFQFQVAVLAFLVVLTPLSVEWHWPDWLSAALLGAVILLLLFAGQTIIFLLRLVAADRRAAGRRRPLASATKTVGELEDERAAEQGAHQAGDGDSVPAPDEDGSDTAEQAPDERDEAIGQPPDDSGLVRQ